MLRKPLLVSLQCRRILGGRNLDRVRDIVVAAIFDFMTVEDWGEVKPYGRCEGERRKGGRGRGEKKYACPYHFFFGKLRTLANRAPDWCGIGK